MMIMVDIKTQIYIDPTTRRQPPHVCLWNFFFVVVAAVIGFSVFSVVVPLEFFSGNHHNKEYRNKMKWRECKKLQNIPNFG